MNWTSTEGARRWIVVVGLVLGPVLVVASAAVGLGPMPDSMRASFDVMAQRAPAILAQDLLETLGFAILLAALAGATRAVHVRGGAIGTLGAVLSVVGITGFGLSNGTGLAVVAHAQLPGRDAAFQAAGAISGGEVIGTAGTVGWILEIVAQLGMLLVLVALWRARLVPIWPAVLCVVGILVNAVVGTIEASLVADVLLLVVLVWVAILLARTPREVWLGEVEAPRRGRRASGAAPQAPAPVSGS
jgi:hypothetical protein